MKFQRYNFLSKINKKFQKNVFFFARNKKIDTFAEKFNQKVNPIS